jgi:hypothetical protein
MGVFEPHVLTDEDGLLIVQAMRAAEVENSEKVGIHHLLIASLPTQDPSTLRSGRVTTGAHYNRGTQGRPLFDLTEPSASACS